MKKIKLKKLLLNFGMLSLGLVTIFGAQLSLSSNASAADPKTEACTALTKIDGKACDAASTQTAISVIIGSVINILSMLVGAVSVIMIIIGGFKYVTSNGDASSTKSAKDTVMYALIGLLLVGFAQTLVRFVWSNT